MTRVWMIAEDDSGLRSGLESLLSLWDVTPLMFEDGTQAWEWLDKVERGDYTHPLPEVALLDVMMPGKLGYQIGRRMRGLAQTRAIPLLIMTAGNLTEQDQRQIQRSAYPEGVIPKPFADIDELRDLIESTIAASKPTLEIRSTNPQMRAYDDQSSLSAQ